MDLVSKTERLDKILAHMGYGSRSTLKQMIKQGLVRVNGKTATDSGMHVDPQTDRITVGGKAV
ncbi:MAG TPA: S4 domain-containing protein, partial [Bacilli bacterium]